MKKKRLLIVIFIITLGFIWGHSAMGRTASLQESLAVAGWVEVFWGKLFPRSSVSVNIIRKLAHFFEYSVLGAEMSLISFSGFHGMKFTAVNCLIVAFLDETIQIFSGRGPMVSDIWIDLAGGVFGSLIIDSILCLLKRKRTHLK